MTQKQGPTHHCLKLGEDFELDLRATSYTGPGAC